MQIESNFPQDRSWEDVGSQIHRLQDKIREAEKELQNYKNDISTSYAPVKPGDHLEDQRGKVYRVVSVMPGTSGMFPWRENDHTIENWNVRCGMVRKGDGEFMKNRTFTTVTLFFPEGLTPTRPSYTLLEPADLPWAKKAEKEKTSD